MSLHYMEFVSHDPASNIALIERTQGLTFGGPDTDLGQARVAQTSDGGLIGVRAPLADHEQPVVRSYLAVRDIAAAVSEAVSLGAQVAYPPTRQGNSGVWASVMQGELQLGFWQRAD